MPPEDTELRNVYRKPSMGSFSVTLVDELKDIIESKKGNMDPLRASLKTIEAGTSGVLEAEKALEEIVNREKKTPLTQETKIQATPVLPESDKKINDGIVHPLVRTVAEQQTLIQEQQAEINRLKASTLDPKNNTSSIVEDQTTIEPRIVNNLGLLPTFVRQEQTRTEHQLTQPETAELKPSELSQNRSEKLIPLTTETSPDLKLTSQIPDMRILRMPLPQISIPRIIKRFSSVGIVEKTLNEQEPVKASTESENITEHKDNIADRIITAVMPNADIVVEKVATAVIETVKAGLEYQRSGVLTDKLIKTLADALKVFRKIGQKSPGTNNT